MEKQVKNKQFIEIYDCSIIDNNIKGRQMNKINGLGGIYLYNENLKRHLNDLNRYNNVRYTKISKQTSLIQQQDEMIDREIKDFMQNRQLLQFNINSIFSSQIQSIINVFKTSQYTTNRFLQQHEIKNQQINLPIFSFDQLLQNQKNNSKSKYSQFMQKIVIQFRQVIMRQIKKMKIEQMRRYDDRLRMKKNVSIQTVYNFDEQILNLRKQIDRKSSQYDILYEYKKNMLNEGQNNIKNYQLKNQYQKILINKLQNQIANKNIQIKKLQIQYKQSQQKLFNKILQIQKLLSINQNKTSLSSIQQIFTPSDFIKQNQILNNFISKINSKKKRYKQRAESILSITQSLFSNLKDKDDIIASMADVAAKSLRQIDVHYDGEINDQLIDQLQKATKTASEAQNLFKILEIYKKNRKTTTSIEKSNSKIKGKVLKTSKRAQRNSSQLSKIQRQSNRNSTKQQSIRKSRVNSRQSRSSEKKQLKSYQKQKDYNKSKFTNGNKINFERIDEIQHNSINTQKYIKQQKGSILKQSLKDLSIVQSKNQDINSNFNFNQPRKKLKKGVSFQFQYQLQPFNKLSIYSKQVDIFIDIPKIKEKIHFNNKGKQDNLYYKPDANLQLFDKHRFTKNKLVKTKLKGQVHKKVNSLLDSKTISAFGFNNQDRSNEAQNIQTNNLSNSIHQNQKQRFSYNNSQQKLIKTGYKQKRSSYSRLERSTFNHNNFSINIQSQQEKQLKIVKQIAAKYKNRGQYYEKLIKMHKDCGQNCEHIRRYLEIFDRSRQQAKKQHIKLNIQNLNNNFSDNLPTITKPAK